MSRHGHRHGTYTAGHPGVSVDHEAQARKAKLRLAYGFYLLGTCILARDLIYYPLHWILSNWH